MKNPEHLSKLNYEQLRHQERALGLKVRKKIMDWSDENDFKVTMGSTSFIGRLLGKEDIVYKGLADNYDDAIRRAISVLRVREEEREKRKQSTINPDALEVSASRPDLLSGLTGKRKYTVKVLTSFPEWITLMEGRFKGRDEATAKAREIIQKLGENQNHAKEN